MDRTDKPRSHSTKKTTIDTNLPTLKSSTLMNKAIVALSKVDIDSRAIREQKERALRATSGAFDKEYQRSQSGFSMRKHKEASSSPAEVRPQRQMEMPGTSAFKLQLKDIREELETQGSAQPLVIDKSKISSKSYGIIKGYSANSHSGPMLSYNEDRICIVTNLTKTSSKHKQISFFGVYDGNAGILKADFLRDHFHLLLLEDLALCADMESAMRRTLQRLTQTFSEDARFQNDESTVSFAIAVIANEEIYYLQSGVCRSVLSQHLGENIFYPSRSETALLTKEPSRKAKSLAEIARTRRPGRELAEVEFRQFGAADGLDFMLLGSEGVFESLRVKEIGKKLWLYLLLGREESVHFALGEANNMLLADVFASPSSKNASIIIVGFEGVSKCLEREEERDKLRLPYLPEA